MSIPRTAEMERVWVTLKENKWFFYTNKVLSILMACTFAYVTINLRAE
jgi:hypothetical protein